MGRAEEAQTRSRPEAPAPGRNPGGREPPFTGKGLLGTQMAAVELPVRADPSQESRELAGTAPVSPARAPTGLSGGTDAPALRVQLERLERAAAVSAAEAAAGHRTAPETPRAPGQESFPFSLPGPGWAAGPPGVTGAVGHGPPLSPGREQPGPASAGALGWAEQADRVFRRDSRRYDGGFYLY